MINRRKFLAFLGATVASPALAEVIPPATPALAQVGEIGPEVVGLPQVVSRGIMLRWEPVLDSTNYHVFRNGVKIAETLDSMFFDEAPPKHVYHYRVTPAEAPRTKAELHAQMYGMGELKRVAT